MILVYLSISRFFCLQIFSFCVVFERTVWTEGTRLSCAFFGDWDSSVIKEYFWAIDHSLLFDLYLITGDSLSCLSSVLLRRNPVWQIHQNVLAEYLFVYIDFPCCFDHFKYRHVFVICDRENPYPIEIFLLKVFLKTF